MELRLEWYYYLNQTKQSYLMNSDWMKAEEALIVAADLEKTGRVRKLRLFDSHDTTWTKKQVIRYLAERETEPYEVIAYFDGGFHPSLKQAGLGIVIYYQQHHQKWRLRHNERIEFLTDNNEAEYAALAFLVNKLEELAVKQQQITIKSDSLTVIKQVSGEWPCYEEDYIPWFERIETKLAQLQLTVQYELIDRAQNKEADQLASQALKQIEISSVSKQE